MTEQDDRRAAKCGRRRTVLVAGLALIAALAACSRTSHNVSSPTTTTPPPSTTPTTTAPPTTTVPPTTTTPLPSAAPLSASQIAAAVRERLPTDTFTGATFQASSFSPPQKPGFGWIAQWDVTEPNGEATSLQFTILDSHQAALDSFNEVVGGLNARSGMTFTNLPAPEGAVCSTPGAYGNYVCDWVDGAVVMTCAGSGGTTSLRSAVFLDGQAELRAVDPTDQY
jgi:hypothetical protein